MLRWVKCSVDMPPMMEDVAVWIDGKRSPAWSNNYVLIAYLSIDHQFYEERRGVHTPLIGVVAWARINKPEF